jgi:LysM repeat protein
MDVFIKALPAIAEAGRLVKSRVLELLPGLRAFHGSINASVLLLVVVVVAELGFSVSPKVEGEIVFGGPEEIASAKMFSELDSSALLADGNVFSDVLEEDGHLEGLVVVNDGVFSANEAGLFSQQEVSANGAMRRVLPGETISSIASLYGVTPKDIARLNGKSEDSVIFSGDYVRVPENIELESKSEGVSVKRFGYLPEGFIWPVAGQIRISTPHGRFSARDIPKPLGTPIVASGDGFVYGSAIGWNGGYGNYVLIEHPQAGVQTMYAHLEYAIVVPGEKVKQGQTIGYMGSTGRSTGPHIHFEVRPL